MHAQIPWELVMDPVGYTDNTSGNSSICHYNCFSTRSHSNEKWLLDSSCPHVRVACTGILYWGLYGNLSCRSAFE